MTFCTAATAQDKMKILLETKDIVLAVKPTGVLSEKSEDGCDAVSLLELETGSEIFPLHRLDRAVGGVMAFAKNRKAAGALSERGAIGKIYIAAVHGKTAESGEMRDLLFKDSRANKSYVVKRMRRGVKEASLEYETLGYSEDVSLVKISLFTGRSHQIRVQFSSRSHPLVGDGKYGASDGVPIALFCSAVRIPDLYGKTYEASALPVLTAYPWSLFGADVLI
ncbi:MAG: RNA pseudouridine synthase [Clostridia bacterium]|nr:RNA pseudouridine synthase [Clostridia bacterium]